MHCRTRHAALGRKWGAQQKGVLRPWVTEKRQICYQEARWCACQVGRQALIVALSSVISRHTYILLAPKREAASNLQLQQQSWSEIFLLVIPMNDRRNSGILVFLHLNCIFPSIFFILQFHLDLSQITCPSWRLGKCSDCGCLHLLGA